MHPDDRKDHKPTFQPIKKVVAGVAALAALALGGSAIAGAATSTTTMGTTPRASAQSSVGMQTPLEFSGPHELREDGRDRRLAGVVDVWRAGQL